MRLPILATTLGVAALLAACAAPGGPAAASPNELRTASDHTDADRRAAVRMELAALHYSRGQFPTALDEIIFDAMPDL